MLVHLNFPQKNDSRAAGFARQVVASPEQRAAIKTERNKRPCSKASKIALLQKIGESQRR